MAVTLMVTVTSGTLCSWYHPVLGLWAVPLPVPDVLPAYGVASLLERLAQASVGEMTVRVQDAGSVYAITLQDPIEG